MKEMKFYNDALPIPQGWILIGIVNNVLQMIKLIDFTRIILTKYAITNNHLRLEV